MRGIYRRKNGQWEARYKKGVGPNGRAQYGAVYGATEEEVIARREQKIAEMQEVSTELNLLILGAGSHGQDVKEIAEALHVFHEISFLDDHAEGEHIVGKCKDIAKFHGKYPCAFVAIGDNEIRKKYAELLKQNKFLIPKLISPSAVISPNAKIAEGTAVLAQATVGAATIEEFCIISQNSSINSSSIIHAFTHIGTGGIVSKNAALPEGSFVQSGQVIH